MTRRGVALEPPLVDAAMIFGGQIGCAGGPGDRIPWMFDHEDRQRRGSPTALARG